MAISATQLAGGEGSDTTDQIAYTTGSVSPGADRLILVVEAHDNSGFDEAPSGLSGNGLTWEKIDSQSYSQGNRHMSLWRSMGSSPSAGGITITFPNAVGGCSWQVIEVTGMDTSGSNGSGAIVQSTKGEAGANATSYTITPNLLSFADATNNATFGAFGIPVNEAITQGTGFTHLGDIGHGTPNNSAFAEWQLGEDLTVDCSWTTPVRAGGIAIEIAVAPAVTTLPATMFIGTA